LADKPSEIYEEWDRLAFPYEPVVSKEREAGLRALYARCLPGGVWKVGIEEAALVSRRIEYIGYQTCDFNEVIQVLETLFAHPDAPQLERYEYYLSCLGVSYFLAGDTANAVDRLKRARQMIGGDSRKAESRLITPFMYINDLLKPRLKIPLEIREIASSVVASWPRCKRRSKQILQAGTRGAFHRLLEEARVAAWCSRRRV